MFDVALHKSRWLVLLQNWIFWCHVQVQFSNLILLSFFRMHLMFVVALHKSRQLLLLHNWIFRCHLPVQLSILILSSFLGCVWCLMWLSIKVDDWSYFRIESSDIIFQSGFPFLSYYLFRTHLTFDLALDKSRRLVLLQNSIFRHHVPVRLTILVLPHFLGHFWCLLWLFMKVGD